MFFPATSTYEFAIATHRPRLETATRHHVAAGVAADRTRSHRAIFRPSRFRVHHQESAPPNEKAPLT